MEPVPDATVYIVDDDTDVREALAWLLRSRRLLSECYDSAEAFDAMLQSRPPPRNRKRSANDTLAPSMTAC